MQAPPVKDQIYSDDQRVLAKMTDIIAKKKLTNSAFGKSDDTDDD